MDLIDETCEVETQNLTQPQWICVRIIDNATNDVAQLSRFKNAPFASCVLNK